MIEHLKTIENARFVVKGSKDFLTGDIVAVKGLEPTPEKIRVFGTINNGQFVPITRAIIDAREVDLKTVELSDGDVVFTPKNGCPRT